MEKSTHVTQSSRSLSIFFPCYNDAGTIATMVVKSDTVAKKLTDDYEIIVIDDGSSDGSRELLTSLQSSYPQLKLVFHEKNRGYGGALRSGFENSTKELIFYTDGDAQYDVDELEKLFPLMSEGVDWVNGFKIKRHDPLHRIIIGTTYQYLIKIAFGIKIKDVDCDFRLIRKNVFDKVTLVHDSGVICVEMMKKFQDAGFHFAETGVHHFFRVYGKSQIFNFKRLARVLVNLVQLWFELVIFRKGTQK
jgi:glycosyltransferase involved in cell wall biosynthesis